MAALHLCKDEFLNQVADYETNPQEWDFKGDKPVVVDFYATWCGPCKRLSPIIEQLSENYKGKVDFYKIDVDREEELARDFGIQSIPTLLFIPKDGEVKRSMGALPENVLRGAIEDLLK